MCLLGKGALSFSTGVRPCSANENRSWLYRSSQLARSFGVALYLKRVTTPELLIVDAVAPLDKTCAGDGARFTRVRWVTLGRFGDLPVDNARDKARVMRGQVAANKDPCARLIPVAAP